MSGSNGKLKISVLSGELLKEGNLFIKLIYNDITQNTDTVNNTKNPKWENAVFEFDVVKDANIVLIECWDKDELVGSGKLEDISQYKSDSQVTVPISKGDSNGGNIILTVTFAGGKATEEDVNKAYLERHANTEEGEVNDGTSTLTKRKKKKKGDGLGGTLGSTRGSLSGGGGSSGSLGRTTGSMHGGGGGGANQGGTLRYWDRSNSRSNLSATQSGTGSRNLTGSGALGSTTSSGSLRKERDPSNPIHNFAGQQDDSFAYVAEKYQTSPGPVYDVAASEAAVEPQHFHATFGNEDRLKHFVTKTPGKGPDLLPNRESTTFQPRPFYASVPHYKAPTWAVTRSFTKDGPLEDQGDVTVRSTSKSSPKYRMGKDSREKYFERKSASQGPAAYQNDKQWTKPSSSVGMIGKTERNTANWIFGK